MNRKNYIYRITMTIIFTYILQTPYSFAQNSEINKTKHQLNQLEIKIKTLEKKLKRSKDKHVFLENELAKTSKQIEWYYLKIKKIQINIDSKEQEIEELKNIIQALNIKLENTQQKISKYLIEQYKTHDTTQLKLIVNQKNIYKADKLLMYYKYLLAANKNLLSEFKATQEELTNKNIKLNNELQQLQSLKTNWHKYLKKLHDDKKYQTTLIKRLSLDIHKKQQTLQDYRQNQINLSKLVNNLTQNSVLQTQHPFNHMKGKLIKPVKVDSSKIKAMNQGLIFYAPEGQPVNTIYPGKVVFADWLNGYGLLIIIDHGWGFMSLYANNLQLLKRVGDNVNAEEKIAKIGHSGVLPENGLYFEIRHHGKAMPSEKWLHQ